MQCPKCGNRMMVGNSAWRKVSKVQYRNLDCLCGNRDTSVEVFSHQYNFFLWAVKELNKLMDKAMGRK